MDGISYIISCIDFSNIERTARAPVFLLIAISAMASSAESVKFRETPYISNNFLYCLIIEFFGSVNIFLNASVDNDFRVLYIGNLPTSSGIKP